MQNSVGEIKTNVGIYGLNTHGFSSFVSQFLS